MTFIKTEDKGKNLHVIEFSIAKEAFDAEVSKVFRERAKNLNVPGFRKGKAPRNIIEKMYGTGVFYEEALNNLLPAEYDAAAKESGLDIISRPEIDVEEITDNGVVIKASVYVRPVVDIKDYKGIEAVKTPVNVTDDEVNARVEAVRERNSRTEDITDRAAELGDIANINYEGFKGGVAFAGGKGEGQDLTLGSGTFIPGFEDQIVGKKVGEQFDVVVTFPSEYHADELAGAEAVFKCKLNSLKGKILPELDDEFAKDVSEFDTLAEYIADVKAKITEEHERQAKAEVDEQLMNALVEKLEGDIPECMYLEEAENLVRDYDMRLRSSGLSLQDYMKYTGKDIDAIRADMIPQATRQVKTRLALEKIADIEKIEVTDDAVTAEIEKIAKAYNMEPAQVTQYVTAENVKRDLQVEGALNVVRDSAKLVDKKPEEKKATKTTAKKTTAKKTEDGAEKKTTAKKTTAAKSTEEKPAAKKTTTKKTEGTAEKKTTTKKTTTAKKTEKAE